MKRKFIYRLLLVFSLLAAFALAGCGTAPETKQNQAKEGKPDIALSDKNSADKISDGDDSDTVKDEKAPAPDNPVSNEASENGTDNNEKASTNGDNSSAGQNKGPISNSTSASKSASSSGSGTISSPSSGGTGKTGGTAGSSASTTSSGSGGTAETKPAGQPAAKPAPKPAAKPAPAAPAATATISIKGPKDAGMILGATSVELKDGDTVLDILLKATGKKIFVDYEGSGATAYVAGIDNYYEFDYGPNSGWTCKKNGATIDRSAGVVKVAKGDRIEWIYIEG